MYAQKSKKNTVLDQFCGGHFNFIAGRSPSDGPGYPPWPGSRQARGIDFWNSPAQSVKNTLLLASLTFFFQFSLPQEVPVLAKRNTPA